MTARTLALLAAAGSAALLASAFFWQWQGYPPCAMCLWQRWPHAAAIGFGILAAFLAPLALWALLGALAALTTAGIGFYHTGVERDWWEGPSSCTASGGLGDNLLPGSGEITVVLCDEVSWAWLGLSMASWNAIASLGLTLVWIAALSRSRRS